MSMNIACLDLEGVLKTVFDEDELKKGTTR